MTHEFKLPSGIECEIKEFTGKQQEILTEQNKKAHSDRLTEMLLSILVRVGSDTNLTEKFVKDEMLAADRDFALIEARQFSMDFEDEFVFMHRYKDSNGNKASVEISEKIPNGHFPMHPVKVKEEGTGDLIPASYTEYSQIEKDVEIVLPRSGERVRFTMLDGKGESIGSATNKNKRSSHTPIMMRRPVRFHKKDGGTAEVPIGLDLNKLAIKDIEHLRSEIKRWEGRVDTELMFENPSTDKQEIVDVMGSVAFFFPSEAI